MSIGIVWKISPGEKAFFWEECKKGKFIALGWSALGDLSNIHDMDELKKRYLPLWDNNRHKAGKVCPQIWNFWNEIQIDDIILANDGQSKIVGIGRVKGVCYIDENKIPLSKKKEYNPRSTKKSFSYIRDVDWDFSFPQDRITIPKQTGWRGTVIELKEPEFKKIFEYLKKGGYDIDNLLKQPPKPLKLPDLKTVTPIYITNKIIPPTPQKGGKSKGKKRVKIEGMSEEDKKAIGKRGEIIVYGDEKRGLIKAKRPDLAEKVDPIFLKDDSAGYDILSFRKDGSKKFIEVKSTKARFNEKNTKFEITANEVNVSKTYGDNYYIYRVFDVTSTSPKIKIIKNPYGRITLEPKVYNAIICFE